MAEKQGQRLSEEELARLRRAYPDPDGDEDAEPHEWTDGILGEWANGAVIPTRAHNGDIKAAAYADLDRMYGEWTRRGEAIQKLLAHIDALTEAEQANAERIAELERENERLRRIERAAFSIDACMNREGVSPLPCDDCKEKLRTALNAYTDYRRSLLETSEGGTE